MLKQSSQLLKLTTRAYKESLNPTGCSNWPWLQRYLNDSNLKNPSVAYLREALDTTGSFNGPNSTFLIRPNLNSLRNSYYQESVRENQGYTPQNPRKMTKEQQTLIKEFKGVDEKQAVKQKIGIARSDETGEYTSIRRRARYARTMLRVSWTATTDRLTGWKKRSNEPTAI